MKLNKQELRDKIYACWIGKNIGGTLGGPFECVQSTVDVDGFTVEPGAPLPNDDLDLQLVWLMAMDQEGPQKVDAAMLGSYWLEYITPYWGEYGICKGNMRYGIAPPMCGEFENNMKDSNGAWIRTEVWACLYPGDVEMAAHYALEDAMVDHGLGDGSYSAVFVAAMESAAFLVSDLRKVIEIGLSSIPTHCATYRYVTTAIECYENGMTWLETRNKITDLALNVDKFGWMHAATNVAYAVIGLLYGNGDFKESMLTACRCGDDTDCTCATVGSLLGIMHGTKIIPEDWRAYIGDTIVTISLNMGALRSYRFMSNRVKFTIPQTCTELTDAIIRLHNVTLFKSETDITDEQTEITSEEIESLYGDKLGLENMKPNMIRAYGKLFDYLVEYDDDIRVKPFDEKKISLTIMNKTVSDKYAAFEWILPEGWSVEGTKTAHVIQGHMKPRPKVEFTVKAGEIISPKNNVILNVTYGGQFESMLIPITFIG